MLSRVSRQMAAKAERIARAKALQEAEWLREAEEGGDLLSGEESDEEAEEVQVFLCVVCDKEFKSEKSLANHER